MRVSDWSSDVGSSDLPILRSRPRLRSGKRASRAMTQTPATVDARVARKIRIDGVFADVLHVGELGERRCIESEAAKVVGKIQAATGAEPGHGPTQQRDVAGNGRASGRERVGQEGKHSG